MSPPPSSLKIAPTSIWLALKEMSNDENDDNDDSDISDGKSSGKPMLHMRREPAACVIGTVSEVD